MLKCAGSTLPFTTSLMMKSRSNRRVWEFQGFHREAGGRPLLMGIVNVTPDSFSDGGRFLMTDAAVEQAMQLVAEGVDILDVGGESTRPGAESVTEAEELRRVVPVIEKLSRMTSVPISIDTSKSNVARETLNAGARIVNDISGLRFDDQMIAVCRDAGCGIVCMHMQGTPQTMQINPQYDDVVAEINEFFSERLRTFLQAGILPERVALDPGVGFGKTPQHNVTILSSIRQFQELGRPVLIGHSRKRFLHKLLGKPVDDRVFWTVGVSVALSNQGVDIIRVHDVAANRDSITAFQAIRPIVS